MRTGTCVKDLPAAGLAAVGALALATTLTLPGATAHADVPEGCNPGAETDFNGDSFPDLVVGDPTATVGGMVRAGTITVSYGTSPTTIGDGAAETLSEDDLDSADGSSAGDQFGFTLDSADIDCDGYTDLLVGTPYEDVDGVQNAGAVHLFLGGSDGVGSVAGTWLTLVDFAGAGSGQEGEPGDWLGYAVDVKEDVGQGGVNGGQPFALAVGVPGRDVGSVADAGAVGVSVPLDVGRRVALLSSGSDPVPGEPGPRVPGAPEPGDQLGTSVAVGQFTGAGDVVDIAVGAPYEDIGTTKNAGDITVLEDFFDGFGDAYRLDQNSTGVPGSAEAADWFGYSLDAAQVGTVGRLAAGVPREDIGSSTDAGAIQVFSGVGGTLVPGPLLDQNTAGVNDVAQAGDLFGHGVAWVPPTTADARSRLSVSVPGEDGSAASTGLVHIIPIFDPADDVSYTQASPGIPGAPQAGDMFGQAITVVTAPGGQALVVGTPTDGGYPDGLVAIIPLDGGPPRALAPDDAGASGFGASLTGDGL